MTTEGGKLGRLTIWIGSLSAAFAACVGLLDIADKLPDRLHTLCTDVGLCGTNTIVVSGKQLFTGAGTQTFNFSNVESGSATNIRFFPWTYVAPKDETVEFSIDFTFPPQQYSLCIIMLYTTPSRGPEPRISANSHVDMTKDGKDPGTTCKTKTEVDLKALDRVQVVFSNNSYRQPDSVLVSGKVFVRHLDHKS